MQDEKPSTPMAALAHFGVIGMRWGVRKGNKGRLRAASAQGLRDAQFRKARRRHYGMGIVNPTYGPVSKFNQRRLAASQKRIQEGKTRGWDVVRAARYLTVADLLIKTTPVKPYLDKKI